MCWRLPAFLNVYMDSRACANVFLSAYMDSSAGACVSQSLYGLLHLCFSVFVWTVVLLLALRFLRVCTLALAIVFFGICMDSCTCACITQCLYGLLCLRLCSSMFVWTLGHLRLCFSVFVWTLVLALVFLSVCRDSCACACVFQYLYGLLCLC